MAGVPVLPDQTKPGFRTLDPVAVLKVTDSQGKTLYEYKQPDRQQVVTPQLAFLMSDILSDNTARTPGFGSNSVLKLTRPAAVKTGTTSDWRDNWTVGYTPDYAVGVWVGNNNNSAMKGTSGVTGAAPIWHDFMEEVQKNVAPKEFPVPPDITVDANHRPGLHGEPNAAGPGRVGDRAVFGKDVRGTHDLRWREPARAHPIRDSDWTAAWPQSPLPRYADAGAADSRWRRA